MFIITQTNDDGDTLQFDKNSGDVIIQHESHVWTFTPEEWSKLTAWFEGF